MNLLLDSHAILWFAAGSARLHADARRAIENADRAYVSSASIWELSVKHAAGRLVAPDDLAADLRELGFVELALGWEHARVAATLPMHHSDPFDRMLVAQAIVEGLTIVTRDPMIVRYRVPTLVS